MALETLPSHVDQEKRRLELALCDIEHAQVCLKLLRMGTIVIATTRFPRDSYERYCREEDFQQWQHRLHIVGKALALGGLQSKLPFDATIAELTVFSFKSSPLMVK
jgi:hypothetical protein